MTGKVQSVTVPPLSVWLVRMTMVAIQSDCTIATVERLQKEGLAILLVIFFNKRGYMLSGQRALHALILSTICKHPP